jgi:hypothetical protein
VSTYPGLRWDIWPDAADVVLLRALTHADETVARAAWMSMRATWNYDSPTSDQYRLFPLLAERVARLDPAHPQLAMLQGIRRQSTIRTLTMLAQLEVVLGELEADGFDAVVLKGPALALSVYDHVGQRPTGDLDILVDPDRFDAAAHCLEARGWTRESLDVPGNHAVAFKRGEVSLDLHRQHWRELRVAGAPLSGWRNLEVVDARRTLPTGRRPKILGTTDALIHTISHGTENRLPINIRWVADAVRLIRTGPVNWSRLIERSRAYEIAPLMHEALRFLVEVSGVEVPDTVLRELAAEHTSRFAELRLWAFHEFPRTDGRLGGLPLTVSRLLKITRGETAVGVFRRSPQYFCQVWDVDHVWQLPGVVIRRARRLRSRS